MGKGREEAPRARQDEAGGKAKGRWKSNDESSWQREEAPARQAPRWSEESLSAEDKVLMKKITIGAQLNKVPEPTPAMKGFAMGNRSSASNERPGSLSRRFGANFQ